MIGAAVLLYGLSCFTTCGLGSLARIFTHLIEYKEKASDSEGRRREREGVSEVRELKEKELFLEGWVSRTTFSITSLSVTTKAKRSLRISASYSNCLGSALDESYALFIS